MKQYGYLRAIILSFYSRELYRDVVKNWGAGTVFYLFLLLALSWGAMMFTIQPMITKNSAIALESIAPQFPATIAIKDGEVKTPENKPYFITDPKNNKLMAIIDTSGKYQNLAQAKSQMLLTKNEFMYLGDENTYRVEKLPKKLNFEFTPGEIKKTLIKFTGYAWLIIFPILLLISFIYRLIEALFYGILGLIFASLSKVPLSYSATLKLSMVAVTPAIVIGTIFDWIGFSFYFEWFFYFVLSMTYLIFAIGSNRND
jgi:hypothetical protein